MNISLAQAASGTNLLRQQDGEDIGQIFLR